MARRFNALAKKVGSSEELSMEEKVIICIKLSTKGKVSHYSLQRKAKAIASMEIGIPYRCKDIDRNYHNVASALKDLSECGVLKREVVKTGNILTIENPRFTYIKDQIAWYEGHIAELKAKVGACNVSGYIANAEFHLTHYKKKLEITPKEFLIEEKFTYYTRLV